jgi:hypothetical protein
VSPRLLTRICSPTLLVRREGCRRGPSPCAAPEAPLLRDPPEQLVEYQQANSKFEGGTLREYKDGMRVAGKLITEATKSLVDTKIGLQGISP